MFRLGLSALLAVLGISLIFSNDVYSEKIQNSSPECGDVILVFARGSSQNKNHEHIEDPFASKFVELENEAGNFFNEFQHQLNRDYPQVRYKAQSVHDFPDKYDPFGYAAVPVYQKGFILPNYSNALGAEFSWWPDMDYRDSVQHGVAEVSGFVKDQISNCPDQKIVMGGYSQGAQVIGESLFKLTEQERQSIGGVGLFGDPKFLGGNNDPWDPYDKPQAYTWKRGSASPKDSGMLEPRIPYVPADMERRVFSWCFRGDIVCAGTSSLTIGSPAEWHQAYPNFGARQAAAEIIQTMSPNLYVVNLSRGGVDKSKPIANQPTPQTPSDKTIDFMFLIDNSSVSGTDVFGTLKTRTPQVLPPLNNFYSNARYGVADYSQPYLGVPTPGISIKNRQQPQRLTANAGNLDLVFNQKLNDGYKYASNIDHQNPHGLAIERTVMTTDWSPDATKHIVLFTTAPYYKTHSYNLCNAAFASSFGISPTVFNCAAGPLTADIKTSEHPEVCTDPGQLLTKTTCQINVSPGQTMFEIKRSITDAVKVAQAKGVAVTIVVPHPINDPTNYYNFPQTVKELEALAKSTGGLFLKYDSFNTASYSDVMWQVLNHTPNTMILAYQDVLGSNTEEGEPSQVVTAKAGVPTVLDVSRGAKAESYHWDFNNDDVIDEVTTAPSIEYIFDQPIEGGFMRVSARQADMTVAELTLPLTVSAYNGPTYSTEQGPVLPDTIKATKKISGEIEITWAPSDTGDILFVGEAESGMPIKSTPVSEGKMTLENIDVALEVWVQNDTATSERVALAVISEPVVIPAPDIIKLPEIIPLPGKLLPISESDPWGQYLGERQPVLKPVDSEPAPAIEVVAAVPVRISQRPQTRMSETPSPAADEQTVLAATTAPAASAPATQTDIDELVSTQQAQKEQTGGVIYVFALIGTFAVIGVGYYFLKNR